MATINEAMGYLDSILLNPKAQKPTVAQRWTRLIFQFQNFINELNNTSLPWTYRSTTVPIVAGTEDYLVPIDVGTVLFAYANNASDIFGPTGLEFADLAGVSSDFYLFNPLDYGISRDFNEVWAAPVPAQLAIYREGGLLKFRIPPFTTSQTESITLVGSTGNWLSGLSGISEAVLPGHHMLPITRAAISLLPGCEWAGDRAFNIDQRQQLAMSLTADEKTFRDSWMIAKRTMHGDQPSYRVPFGGNDY